LGPLQLLFGRLELIHNLFQLSLLDGEFAHCLPLLSHGLLEGCPLGHHIKIDRVVLVLPDNPLEDSLRGWQGLIYYRYGYVLTCPALSCRNLNSYAEMRINFVYEAFFQRAQITEKVKSRAVKTASPAPSNPAKEGAKPLSTAQQK